MLPEKSAMVTGTPVTCGATVSQDPLVPAYSDSPLACDAWNAGNTSTAPNCCTPQQSAVNYYPEVLDDTVVTRKSVPGGGMPFDGGDPAMYN